MMDFAEKEGKYKDRFFSKITSRSFFLVLSVALLIYNDVRLMQAAYDADSPPVWLIGIFYVSAIFSTFALFQSQQPVVRMLFRILFFSVIYTDSVYLIIGNFPFSYPDAINLLNNPTYASGSFTAFKVAFLLAFAASGFIFAGVLRSVNRFTIPYAIPWVLVFAGLQILLFTYAKNHPGVYDFVPSLYRVSGNLLTANIAQAGEKWKRANVIVRPGPLHVQHLFVVVDESVEGSCLSVNGFPLSTTPFLQKEAGQFLNFGIASSYTNYSAGSNLALLAGMCMDELPDKGYRSFCKPSLFQYAQKAGYQTFLLDAQSNGQVLQNYTTRKDLPFIDSLFQPGVVKGSGGLYLRDSLIAEKIVLLASRPVPTFAYVNKAGAHWPYSTNFPAWFSGSHVFGAGYNSEAAYFNSIRWNVDRFWEQLATNLADQRNILMLYTSDHGENYSPGLMKVTHASIYKPAKLEGQVPLLVYDHAGFFPAGFSPLANRYSHQAIFPTLLSAMGYDSCFVRRHYGRSLLDLPLPGARWFQAGDLFGRGKNQRIFIDPLPARHP